MIQVATLLWAMYLSKKLSELRWKVEFENKRPDTIDCLLRLETYELTGWKVEFSTSVATIVSKTDADNVKTVKVLRSTIGDYHNNVEEKTFILPADKPVTIETVNEYLKRPTN